MGQLSMEIRTLPGSVLSENQQIMAKRSVVGAAEQVGLSPSAVSHALSRLRVMLNDELFTRTPGGLEPSPRALELHGEITTGLSHIANAIEAQHRFDPSKSERVFTMQIADYVSGILLPRLTERLCREAPGVSVNVMPFSVASETRNESADVQIRFTPNDRHQTEARNMRLLTDRFIVVMRPDHPAVGRKMTPELYASLHHVKLSQAATGTTLIDDALARRGLQRRIVMTVPGWFDMPEIVEKTDLVAIVPSHWPEADARLRRLHSVDLPLEEVRFSIDLCWDVRRERDPAQRWFRHLITEIFERSQASH